MDEIFRLCDAVTVLRDGRHVDTRPIASLDRAALVEMMIGRRLDEYFPAHVEGTPGEELLRVEGLTSPAGLQRTSRSASAPAKCSASPGWSAPADRRSRRRCSASTAGAGAGFTSPGSR